MTLALPTVRAERMHDAADIRLIHESAFPTDAEGQLVDRMRQAGRLMISLVATIEQEVVGHIAFSPVALDGTAGGLGLAPVAVAPNYQRQGIGSNLVRAGLGTARAAGAPFIVVLGDARFYGRFGFQPASRWQLVDEFAGHDAFQAIVFRPDQMPAGGGLVTYGSEFA